MNFFNRKIKKKHLERFCLKIAELLEPEMPQLKRAIGLFRIHGVYFTYDPRGISILHEYNPEDKAIIKSDHKTRFKLSGVSVFNKKENVYEPLRLNYQSDVLALIYVENPEYFHRFYDLNKVKKDAIEVEHIILKNPDREIAEKALESLTKEQIELLELEYAFEIELDDKQYYTILDMEDGNYMAVDKNGKIYRLLHDHEQRVKLIAHRPADFFNIYHGNKSELYELFDQ